MSNIFYDELKGLYSLPVKQEWQEQFDIKAANIFSRNREALTSLEKTITEAHHTILESGKRNERISRVRTIIFAALPMACFASVAIAPFNNKTFLNTTAFITGCSILASVSMAGLFWQYISGGSSKMDSVAALEILRIRLLIKDKFQDN